MILKFITKPNYFVGHVAVNGVPEPPNEGQSGSGHQARSWEGYIPATSCKTAEDRLADIIKRNGFYHATFKPATPPPTPRSKK